MHTTSHPCFVLPQQSQPSVRVIRFDLCMLHPMRSAAPRKVRMNSSHQSWAFQQPPL